MKNSPLNNIFSTAAMGGITNNSSGNLAARAMSSLMGKSSRKLKPRVKKLENQVRSMISKQNQGPTAVETPIEIQPETPTGTVPQAFDGGMQEEEPQLLPNSPTIASPFTPGAQQAAGGMFGAPMPGSFDRNMGEEEEIY